MTPSADELHSVKTPKEVARELREWFEEAIEVAVELDAKDKKTAPFQRISRDPDGCLWYYGPEGEFQFEIVVHP